MSKIVLGIWVCVLFALSPASVCSQEAPPVDSTRSAADTVEVNESRTFSFVSPFDTIHEEEYRLRHAISLDQLLEVTPGYFLSRLGPIGADAAFSRYGIGAGRGAVYLGNVLLNDPQDDRAPLAVFPTTAIGEIVHGSSAVASRPMRNGIEGALQIVEPHVLPARPSTMIDVSTADRGLRQRRVRFSSSAGAVGIDFSLDELRNNGYAFDASGLVGGPDFGRSSSRTQSLNVRGDLREGGSYLFAFRRFTSTFQGDLSSLTSERRRSGHYGLAQLSAGGLDVTVYERGHKLSVPDSITHNQTNAVAITVPFIDGAVSQLDVTASYEDIVSRQRVGGGISDGRLQSATLGLNGRLSLGRGASGWYALNAARQFQLSSEWGARIGVNRAFGSRSVLTLEGERSFRLPNLGELFLPAHAAKGPVGTVLQGNRNVQGESMLEARARLFVRVGRVENELRGAVMRVDDPILFVRSGSNISSVNGGNDVLHVVEDRLRIQTSYRGTMLAASSFIAFAPGDRAGFFQSVPEYRAGANVSIGRSTFKNTSRFLVTGEYLLSGSRVTPDGHALEAFNVLNLRLDVRLIDAHLYVSWLNVLDEQYETFFSYLMTPSTVIYGVAWTFYD